MKTILTFFVMAMMALVAVGCGDDASSESHTPDNGVYEFGVDSARFGSDCLGSVELIMEMEATGRVEADLDAGPITRTINPRDMVLCDPDMDDCSDIRLTGPDGADLVYRQTYIGVTLRAHGEGLSFESGEVELEGDIISASSDGEWLMFDFPHTGVDYSKPMSITAYGAGQGDIATAMESRLDFIKAKCLN